MDEALSRGGVISPSTFRVMAMVVIRNVYVSVVVEIADNGIHSVFSMPVLRKVVVSVKVPSE